MSMGLLTAARFFRFCGLECFVEIDFACDSSLDVSFVYAFQVANGVLDALPKDGVDWLFVFQAPTAIVGIKVCQTYGHLYGTRGCGIGGNYFKSLIVDRAKVEAQFLEEPFLCRRRWSCEENKALWPNGFIVRFYKVLWEDVKGVLLKVYRAFHKEGKLQGLQTSLSPH
ncbi:hypothetical protein V6N11_031462 [Hibiscus sabdariffa]|uniref:Uncharacterized protein n=1 Tax=Hibiscus sabdariffa TaxID=183260 RepID=A0ABR2SYH8_9ROSI